MVFLFALNLLKRNCKKGTIMTDETVERLIRFLANAARNAHRDERKWKKNDWLRGFHGGLSDAYLTAAKIAKGFQRQDKKRRIK